MLSDSPWPFTDPENTAAFTSGQVTKDNAPVLLVFHDHGGEWQFVHGDLAEGDECVVVSLGCAVGRDLTLRQLADMPSGWMAWRDSTRAAWQREPYESGEDEA